MSDTPHQPLSVYRLLTRTPEDARALGFDDSVIDLVRWQLSGSLEGYPTVVRAEWFDEDWERKLDFPSGRAGLPVLSRRLTELLGEETLLRAGHLLPLRIDGVDQNEHRLFVVNQVIDCLDADSSSAPDDRTGKIQKSVFRPDAVPADLPAFRIPQFPTVVHWNGWAALVLTGLLGDELEARLVWSEDPTRIPHPDPWGF
jgi:hypothetical protein